VAMGFAALPLYVVAFRPVARVQARAEQTHTTLGPKCVSYIVCIHTCIHASAHVHMYVFVIRICVCMALHVCAPIIPLVSLSASATRHLPYRGRRDVSQAS
jgi:hypothetical protein